MKNLTAACRRLFDRRSNHEFFGSIRSGLSYKSVRISEQLMQDDCFHKQSMSKHISFWRGSGVGILGSLARVQIHGFCIHHRNLASVASTPVRNQSFAMINSDNISYFKKILGERGVVQEDEKLDDANTDWMRKYRGSSKLMLQPKSTQEVSQILDYCNSRCLAVVPQGGNTGLVGGSVPLFDEVIINIGSMNNILSFDKLLI